MIKVFNAPAPEFSPNNFFLDTRTFEQDGIRHLRQVDLHDDSGPTFDYGSALSWGAFTMPDLDAISIHPNGYAAAISFDHDQMSIVKLADAGVPDDRAPIALPFTGTGVREGLMMGPTGMTITADGRILVLERTGARIQAFDNLGNPTQCFAAQLQFDLPTSLENDLDAQTVGPALLRALQQAVPVRNTSPDAFDKRYLLQPLLRMQSSFVSDLDAGNASPDSASSSSWQA